MAREEDRATQSSAGPHLEGEASTQTQHPQMSSSRVLRAWQLTTFVLAIFVAAVLAASFVYAARAVIPGVDGQLGYDGTLAHFERLPAVRLTGFEPESPLPAAGIGVGDLLVDQPRGSLRDGEIVKLRVAHEGILRDVEVRAVHIDRTAAPAVNALDFCLTALVFLVGLFVALRRRRDVAALAFASLLLLAAGAGVPTSVPAGRFAASIDLWRDTTPVFALVALGYCSMMLGGGYRSPARPWTMVAIAGLCTAWAVWSSITMAPYYLGRIWITADALLIPVASGAYIAALLLCVFALIDTWRHVEPEPRQRLRWLFVGFAFWLFGASLFPVWLLGAFGGMGESLPFVVRVAADLAFGASLVTVTYAILRHRVIDVGFVIGRTLVFAAFTSLLLVLFGIVEWLLDHLFRFKGRESSVLLDGAIAVALYLAVHPTRYAIERLVERVIFRASHERQAALQHFLDTAANFSEPDSLATALLKAVDAYATSPGSGIYRRDKTGSFVLEKSTLDQLPRELGTDAELIVELKTSRKPYRFGRLALASAALAIPVVRRSELVGFLAVSEKTDRTLYRPDEIETLVRTVNQVSSDLYALQLERVEQRRQELEEQNEALRNEFRSVVVR